MSDAPVCPLSNVEKILLATDRSEFSEGAVREAINFANKCASRLYVVSALEANPEYETIGASVYEKEEQEAVRYLETVKARATQEGLYYCEIDLLYGREPYRLIVDEAAERKIDMIVIGRRGRSGLMKALMGGVAAKVIGHAPCKVLVVPRAARIECRNILVATDGSEHSYEAATEAIGIAKRCGSNVIAVSAIHSDGELVEARVHVNRVVEMAHQEDVPVSVSIPTGRPYHAIVETAGGRGVDLIVMGSHGRTSLKSLFMGSTAERVIGLANCAVLVARSK